MKKTLVSTPSLACHWKEAETLCSLVTTTDPRRPVRKANNITYTRRVLLLGFSNSYMYNVMYEWVKKPNARDQMIYCTRALGLD